jgi:hypothetical protein
MQNWRIQNQSERQAQGALPTQLQEIRSRDEEAMAIHRRVVASRSC